MPIPRRGEAEDPEKSILFIEKAARLGLEDAEEEKAHFYTLAAIHYSDADLDRSLYFARKAIELTDDLSAIENLALNIYQDGEDVYEYCRQHLNKKPEDEIKLEDSSTEEFRI